MPCLAASMRGVRLHSNTMRLWVVVEVGELGVVISVLARRPGNAGMVVRYVREVGRTGLWSVCWPGILELQS